jgi:hypothetical protein
MLDVECFTYLNMRLEDPMAPTVVLATNRGNSLVRGTPDVVAPHGVPIDLLDRCLIVKTEGYSREQVAQVVQLRAATEGLALGEGVLERLAEQGERASLRSASSPRPLSCAWLTHRRAQIRAAATLARRDPRGARRAPHYRGGRCQRARRALPRRARERRAHRGRHGPALIRAQPGSAIASVRPPKARSSVLPASSR